MAGAFCCGARNVKSSIGVRPSCYMRSEAARRVAWMAAGRSSKCKNSLVLRGMLKVGGPGQDLSNFQMVPIPILSVLTCSTS